MALCGRRHQATSPAATQIQNSAVKRSTAQASSGFSSPSAICTPPSRNAKTATMISAADRDRPRAGRSPASIDRVAVPDASQAVVDADGVSIATASAVSVMGRGRFLLEGNEGSTHMIAVGSGHGNGSGSGVPTVDAGECRATAPHVRGVSSQREHSSRTDRALVQTAAQLPAAGRPTDRGHDRASSERRRHPAYAGRPRRSNRFPHPAGPGRLARRQPVGGAEYLAGDVVHGAIVRRDPVRARGGVEQGSSRAAPRDVLLEPRMREASAATDVLPLPERPPMKMTSVAIGPVCASTSSIRSDYGADAGHQVRRTA